MSSVSSGMQPEGCSHALLISTMLSRSKKCDNQSHAELGFDPGDARDDSAPRMMNTRRCSVRHAFQCIFGICFLLIFVNYMVFRRDHRDCYRDSYLFVGTVGTVLSELLR